MQTQETRFSIISFFMVGNSSRSKDKGRGGRNHGGAAFTSTAARLDAASHGETGETEKPDGGATAAELIPEIKKTITPERLAEIDKANYLAVAFARNEPLSQADFDFLGLYLLKSIKAAILSACGWHWHEGKELLDDLVYDAFIKVMKYLQTFTGEKGRLGSLVSVIAIHHFYNAMKSRRREQADALDHFNYLCSVNPDYRASIAENWIINTED